MGMYPARFNLHADNGKSGPIYPPYSAGLSKPRPCWFFPDSYFFTSDYVISYFV